jgi:hypothetical protein
LYTHGSGGGTLSGLTDGNSYYIIKKDVNSIQLAATLSDANAGNSIDLGTITLAPAGSGPSNKFTKADAFTSPNHSFTTGNYIKYTSTTSGGLAGVGAFSTTNNFYYIIVIDSNTFQLAASLSNANAGIPVHIHPSSSTSRGISAFNLSTFTITRENTIIAEINHRFTTGDAVVYTMGVGGIAISGLVNGGIYYIINNDANSIKLATTYANAIAGTAIELFPSSGTQHKLTKQDTITYANHGLNNGDALVYNALGNVMVGGLTNGSTYYVKKLNDNTLQLSYNNTLTNVKSLQPSSGTQKLTYYP